MHRCAAALFVLLIPNMSSAADGDFQPLFDGKSTEGWVNKTEDGQPNSDNKWTVKDGVLTAAPGNGWLSTKEMYGDFVLKLEWRVPENGNSGVFIRTPDLKPGQHPHIDGIEIQVLDDNGPQYKGQAGALSVFRLDLWRGAGEGFGLQGSRRVEPLRDHLPGREDQRRDERQPSRRSRCGEDRHAQQAAPARLYRPAKPRQRRRVSQHRAQGTEVAPWPALPLPFAHWCGCWKMRRCRCMPWMTKGE